jgi:hypothetical protein
MKRIERLPNMLLPKLLSEVLSILPLEKPLCS